MLAGPAQMQVGTKWKETREMFGKEATEIMWITALEPDKRYVAEAESHGTKYWSEFAFEEVDGGTRVQMTFRGTPQTLFAKIMSALMGSMMKGSLVKVMKEDLEDIKVAAEK